MNDYTSTKKKSHRERHSGRKAEKKQLKKKTDDSNNEKRNPKAYSFNSAVRAERRFRRKQDIETKKQHIPLVDRTLVEPPPILIAVVGPPKVGKSTLINNLIKLFTKTFLTDIKGPVTIVIGKKRRVTLVECNNDINCMIDLAKVADLVLLLCDASFGFEMEVFEFLNICQVHGMPKIMGVLTHLDMIRNKKTLKNTKKTLKHRFWTEVYSGAKLFYLSGILHGEYLHSEVKNLGRFISVMKFRPLVWRSTHSYMLADRYEDLTSNELIRRNPKCDRNISLYGYVRGIPLNKGMSVHIAGFGDIGIHDISYLSDPCPLPETIKKRALVEKEKFIYAPFSGVGGIVYDKDAVYVELGGSHSHHKRNEKDSTDNIVTGIIESKETLDTKLHRSEMQLFTGGEKLTAEDMNGDFSSEDVPEVEVHDKDLRLLEEKVVEDSGRTRRKVIFDDDMSKFDSESEADSNVNSESEADSNVNSESENEQDDNSNTVINNHSNNFVPEGLKENKSKDVHDKISDVLKNLNKPKSMHEDHSQKNRFADVLESSSAVSDQSSEESSDDDVSSDGKGKVPTDNENKFNIVGSEETAVEWKENLAKKAESIFLNRLQAKRNLMRLVYGLSDDKLCKQDTKQTENADQITENEIGFLFKVVSNEQQKQRIEKDTISLTESSLAMAWKSSCRDFTLSENKLLIQNRFVTGKWKDSEDASELLKIDAAEDSETFDDFEDLETGEKFSGDQKPKESQKRKLEDSNETDRKTLMEKKLKLKEKFDSEYDNADDGTYYDDLKRVAEKQSQLNKSAFENLNDDVRIQIEGYRPGMYVRIEFLNVPCEFVTNFDPTYPIIMGALNIGEENISYVNVKLKKHRWCKKVLKSNDPLIISLGWRRFQVLPLYSKLEDNLKFRFLKYTPQHITCNAHFWGPVTPQGTGFIALQNCEGNPEVVRQQGFRIAATGSVQEMDKSTQIMKKLKLIGYPMKIYKKTAFIKGMFNSTLEVARFEGAKIKTVSGIRGQIKKAAAKPEGCFRATFEDKIQLSDIVFCRTWYRVDIQHFYNPVTTLLLPLDKKTSWKGVCSTGELKKKKGIKNPAAFDSLYTEIVRNPKVFKPLVIPKKLQQALPYRDKPKHTVKSSEKKNSIERVTVIKEPHEQKISKMIKMIRTSYHHKQEQLKVQTKERLEKHRRTIEAQEAKKSKKLQLQKKEVFRLKSKRQIREEKNK